MKARDAHMLQDILGRLDGMRIKGVSIDSRTIKEGELFVALRGDRFDGHDFVPDAIKRGAWGALVERTALEGNYGVLGGLQNLVAVEDTLFSLQEMAMMHRRKFNLPVVGVTGSNGKTTTKEMLTAILQQRGPVLKNEGNLNNHIGVPLTLLKLQGLHRFSVIEMGMSARGEIDTLGRLAAPAVGVITNVGPAHLEFLGTVENVAEAKGELLAHLGAEGTAVLNADDRFVEVLRRKCRGPVVTFGLEQRADVRAEDIAPAGAATDFTIIAGKAKQRVRLRAAGRHNVANALAAAAAALALDTPLETTKFGLEEFHPVAMRSEFRDLKGRTVLADYYNANPGSVGAALEALASIRGSRRAAAVLGDMLELGEGSAAAHRAIGAAAARSGLDLLIAFGPSAQLIAEGALQAGMARDRTSVAATHAEAAALLRERTHAGDLVLVKGSRGMKMEKILEEF